MVTKKLIAISSIIAVIFSTFISAKIEFLIAAKKINSVCKTHKAIEKQLLGEDYVDLNDVQYNINIMWINKNLKEEQEGIHPKNDEFVETILNWAESNQRSVVNVWFDSELTSKKAIDITQSVLDEKRHRKMAKIVLKDLRKLPEVKDNSDVFSDSRMPVYFRADLARAIVLHNMVISNPNQYSIYSDLDINPLAKYHLFDRKTLKNLKKYGLVMAKHEGYHENGFQIMSSHKPNLIKAHKLGIIDSNILEAHKTINGDYADEDKKNRELTKLAENVYYKYKPMFQYFYALEGHAQCIMDSDDMDYNIENHGLQAFGKFRFNVHDEDALPQKYDPDGYGTVVPCKDVNYPPRSGQYYA